MNISNFVLTIGRVCNILNQEYQYKSVVTQSPIYLFMKSPRHIRRMKNPEGQLRTPLMQKRLFHIPFDLTRRREVSLAYMMVKDAKDRGVWGAEDSPEPSLNVIYTRHRGLEGVGGECEGG